MFNSRERRSRKAREAERFGGGVPCSGASRPRSGFPRTADRAARAGVELERRVTCYPDRVLGSRLAGPGARTQQVGGTGGACRSRRARSNRECADDRPRWRGPRDRGPRRAAPWQSWASAMYGMVSSQSGGGKGRSLRRPQLGRGSPRAPPGCSSAVAADPASSPGASRTAGGTVTGAFYARLLGFLKHTWTGLTMAVGKRPHHAVRDSVPASARTP